LAIYKEEGITIISFFNPRDTQYNWLESQDSEKADPTLFDEFGKPKPAFWAVFSALIQ